MLLNVKDLSINYRKGNKSVSALQEVSISVSKGEVVAVVGESGSGKSTLGLAIMQLLPPPASVSSGEIILSGKNVLSMPRSEARKECGSMVSMVFQEPVSYLNPVMKVGDQISETLMIHENISKREAISKAIHLFRRVKIFDPERVYNYYPHQLSGGMAQRACIAMAIACGPSLMIADEPTTSLDLTIQAQVLHLLKELREEMQMAMILISHDLRVVSGMADRVVTLYAGRVAEEGTVSDIFHEPKHPYTRALMRASGLGNLDRTYDVGGSLPDLANPPSGCRFQPRCPFAFEPCGRQPPENRMKEDYRVYCWLYDKKEGKGEDSS
ncbi:MAG: ABC transporter ATP-binding protein [Nitrososphaerota archaeon]|nr:ABC transporter ATP-binding protein [Nitrososphaerota archaeon]